MINAQSHHALNLDEVFAALQRPLDLIEDPQRRDEMQRFLDAARVHQERAVFDLLSDLIGADNEASTETRFALTYEARQLRLAAESNSAGEETLDPMVRMDGDLEKVTIRLPKPLKQQIDQAAADRGVSLNGWYVEALARSAFHQMRRRMRREAGRDAASAWGQPTFPRGGRRGGRRRGGQDAGSNPD